MSRRVTIFGSSFASGPTFLFDDPTITAGIAAPWATFRLKSGYAGPIVDVRRTVSAVTTIVSVGLGSSNFLTLNSPVTAVVIGSSSATNLGEFVAAGGYSDPDALGSPQDWFYSRGYSQVTGAMVWEHTVATEQPRGGTAGVMTTRDGVAEAYFDGSNDYMNFGMINGATRPADYSVIAIGAFDSPLNQRRAICASTPDNNLSALTWGTIWNRNTNPARLETAYGDGTDFYIGASTASVFVQGQRHLMEVYKQQGVIRGTMYTDGAARAITDLFGGTAIDSGGINNQNFRVGRNGGGAFSAYLLGGVQFIGVWTAHKEAERLAIKAKINEILGTIW
jgi:hypothetical protein